MDTTQPKKSQLDYRPLLNFPKQNLGGTPATTPPTGLKQKFLSQARSQATPKAGNTKGAISISPKSTNIDKDLCRTKYTVFGQITFPIVIIILLLIIASVVIFFSVRYYKSKVLIANSSLIKTPVPLNITLTVPNSNNSPNMISNDFSYLFWLFITPPSSINNKNFLVFIRDSSDVNTPTFCVYLSNSGGTLNVASLLSSSSSPTDQQKTLIQNLQFDQLPELYLVSSTNQISFYKWFFVSIIGSQNQLQLYISAIGYDTQINLKNRALQTHSSTIDIGPTSSNKFNTLPNSFISKLIVYNYPVNQTTMQKTLKYGPQ